MLADLRRAAVERRGRPGKADRKAGSLHPALAWVVIFDETAIVPDLRVLDQFGIAVHRARPDSGGEQDVEPFGGRLRLQPFARPGENFVAVGPAVGFVVPAGEARSEEHTSELQS